MRFNKLYKRSYPSGGSSILLELLDEDFEELFDELFEEDDFLLEVFLLEEEFLLELLPPPFNLSKSP